MKAIKRAIILCWIMLVVCFIIKLFGGNWFEIICNNEHFIYICNYIDKHIIVKEAMAGLFYFVSSFLIIRACSMLPRLAIKKVFIVAVSIVAVWFTKYIHFNIKSILESILIVFLPVFINIMDGKTKQERALILKKTWYYGIVTCILVLCFQLISLITKNVGLNYFENNSLIALILMVDYYLMIALYYLYMKLRINKKRRKYKMGSWGFFFFSKEIEQLEAFKKTLTNPAEIAEVDKQISELRAKEAEAKADKE